MEIKYIERNGKVLALTRIKNKVFVNVDIDKQTALNGLMLKVENPKFALYDMDAPTSMHNSSVRTRV